ncbi:MAG: MFS transporter [Bacillota bacterium]
MKGNFKQTIITANFMALFGAIFFLFFALDYHIPILPFYTLDAGGSEASVGMLMGLFTTCSIVLRPFQGRDINQKGKKRLLVMGIALYAAAGLGLLLLPKLPILFVLRAIQGFGWGAFLLAFNTLTLDLAPPGKRGTVVGLMGMAPPLSLATAPILGEHLRITTESNYLLLFLVASAAAFAALILGALVKEPARESGSEEKKMLFSHKVLYPSLIIFCMTYTLGAILTFLPLLGEVRDIRAIGYFFTIFALTTVIVRPAAGRLSDYLGRENIYIPALIVAGGALLLIAYADWAGQLLLSAFILGVGFGAAHSSVMALAADRLPVMERGIGMATFTAAFDLGIVVGSITLGVLLTWFDFKVLFVLCAIIMVLPVFGRKLKSWLSDA